MRYRDIMNTLVKIELKHSDYFYENNIWIFNCVAINGAEITILKKDIPPEIITEINGIPTKKKLSF